ncbi:MAG: hypothetical protein LBP38_01815 [Desulfovibrio sp.]|nr:hypothetical protein [Desulfovibrio sp.]
MYRIRVRSHGIQILAAAFLLYAQERPPGFLIKRVAGIRIFRQFFKGVAVNDRRGALCNGQSQVGIEKARYFVELLKRIDDDYRESGDNKSCEKYQKIPLQQLRITDYGLGVAGKLPQFQHPASGDGKTSRASVVIRKRSQGKHIEIIELMLHQKLDGKSAFSVNILKYHIIIDPPD